MPTNPRAGVDLQVDYREFQRNIRNAINDARDFDSALQGIIGTSGRVETALNGIQSRDIDITVNESEVDSALRLINGLEGNVNVRLDVVGDELDQAEEDIRSIRNMQAIELTIDLAGTALEFLSGGFETALDITGVGGLFEMQTLLAQMEAQVGELIPDAEYLINEIFTDGWGDSREQISQVLTQAQQLQIGMEDLEVATRNALVLSDITGEDPARLLESMTLMVRTGLVPDFETAGNVITTGFQNGLNIADDFLDTLGEYAPAFTSLGFDAEETLNVLNAGLEAGIWNTDQIAVSFQEFRIRANELGTLDPAFEQLGLTDMAEDFREGTLAGDDFIEMIMVSLASIDDPLTRQTLAVQMFGTAYEDFNPDTFINALTDVDEQIEVTNTALDDAGTVLSETLPSAWERFQRVVSTGVGESLNERFNITELLDDFTSDATTFFDELDAGTSIQGAFRIAFDDSPVVEMALELEEVLSDFLFSFLQGASELISIIPGVSSSGIDNLISSLAGGELTLDLATAETADDISEAISEALERGVETSDVLSQLGSQFEEAVNIGDIEQIVALRDAIQSIADTSTGGNLLDFGIESGDIDRLIEATGMLDNDRASELILDDFISEFSIPPEMVDSIREQLEAVIDSPELFESTVDMSEFIDIESVNETADAMIANLTQQMNDAMDAENWSEALNIAGALEEATGEDTISTVEFLAQEMGANLDEIEISADDASMGVTTAMEEIDDATVTTTNNLVEALGEGGDSFSLMREVAVEELDATEARYQDFTEAMSANTARIAMDIGGLNLALNDLAINMASVPNSFGGIFNNTTNFNQTNFNTSPAQAGNADAQVAEVIEKDG